MVIVMFDGDSNGDSNGDSDVYGGVCMCDTTSKGCVTCQDNTTADMYNI